MVRKLIVCGLVGAMAVGLTACSQPLSRGEKGALIGGGAGALIGGVAGGGTGALIGAASGALVGGVIGHSTQKKCKVYYSNGKCKVYYSK